MKKKDNKGFSLIELIIAIAILVILTGLLAPQFMKYMEKSREAKDMQSLDTIYGAVQTALANEEAYKEVKALKSDDTLAALRGVGLPLNTIIENSADKTGTDKTGTDKTPKSYFCREVVETMGSSDADKLWSSGAISELAGGADKNTVIFVAVSSDLRVSVWAGIAGAANGELEEADYTTSVLNPTTALTNGAQTVGATFAISK